MTLTSASGEANEENGMATEKTYSPQGSTNASLSIPQRQAAQACEEQSPGSALNTKGRIKKVQQDADARQQFPAH